MLREICARQGQQLAFIRIFSSFNIMSIGSDLIGRKVVYNEIA